MDKILRIDVGAEGGPKIREERLGEYAGLAGRALTTAVICKEVPPTCHALGPENKLVFAPGMLCATTAGSSGRISVGCKSPLTGGIKESNAGGTGGQYMARLNYAAIIIEGQRRDDHLCADGVDDLHIARRDAVVNDGGHHLRDDHFHDDLRDHKDRRQHGDQAEALGFTSECF